MVNKKYNNYLKFDKPRSIMLHTILSSIVDSNINGSFAELGVYKGDTALIINEYAKNRNVYLFDTFDGFVLKDLKKENINEKLIDNFLDTSDMYVLERLANSIGSGNVIIKKGYFPDTAKGLESEMFSFVHLDADLKEPIEQGLLFFWPKLVCGGVLVIHDYISKKYPNVKKVLDTFFQNKQEIIYTLMGTVTGSAVIYKCKG